MKRAENAGNTGGEDIRERHWNRGLALCAVHALYLPLGLTHQWQGVGPILSPLSPGPLGGGRSRSLHLLNDTAGCCCGLVGGTGTFPGGMCVGGLTGTLLNSSHWPLWFCDPGYYVFRSVSLFESGTFIFYVSITEGHHTFVCRMITDSGI